MIRVRVAPIWSARVGVARVHRHNRPPLSAYVAWEAVSASGWAVGWATLGRPVSRELQAQGWAELTRVATDGTPHACSALYGAAARWARRRAIPLVTYTLATEPGTSLRAAGWRPAWTVKGRAWDCKSRARKPGTVDGIDKVAWVPGWMDATEYTEAE